MTAIVGATPPVAGAPAAPVNKSNATVALFAEQADVDAAIRSLRDAHFALAAVSIVGKGHHTDESVIGYYTTTDRMKYWGSNGAFWGGLWALLFGSASFMIPGIGPLLAAGPVVGWIVAALESALVVGGLSAIGAGLYSVGIPEDSVIKYDVALKAGKYLLVVNGSAEEVVRAKAILATANGATDVEAHVADTLAATLA
jgi:hypothetical protein